MNMATKIVLSLTLLISHTWAAPYYVIGDFEPTSDEELIDFAYTVDICSERGGEGTEAVKYECISPDSVRQTVYSDRDCTTVAAAADVTGDVDANPKLFTSEDDIDFNCDEGSTHDYVVSSFGISRTCSPGTLQPNATSAINVCVVWEDVNSTLTDCDETSTIRYRFEGLDCPMMDNTTVNELETNSECAFYEKRKRGNALLDIYSKVYECVVDGELIGGAVFENQNNNEDDDSDNEDDGVSSVFSPVLITLLAGFAFIFHI